MPIVSAPDAPGRLGQTFSNRKKRCLVERPDSETPICRECEMEFDRPGIDVDGEIYCCEACSRGEPCVCPQHDNDTLDTDVPTPAVSGEPGPL